MSEKYEVSLIIPVYNGERYLKECLNSICSQSIFKIIEVILIDDGSTDNSSKICDSYASIYNNISVIHQANKGLVASRKIGANIATSKYITYVDADDWIDCNYVESLLNAMKFKDCELVISDMKYEFNSHSKEFEFAIKPGIYNNQKLEYFKNKYLYSDNFFGFGSCVCVCGKLFVSEKYRPFQNAVPDELKIGEDVAVSVPYVMSLKGAAIQLENVFYHYRQTETSMVHNRTNPMREAESEKLYACLDEALKHNIDFLKRLNYYKASMLIGLMKNNCNLRRSLIDKFSEIRRLVNEPDNRKLVRDISFKTLGIQYKVFFACFRMRLYILITILILLFS